MQRRLILLIAAIVCGLFPQSAHSQSPSREQVLAAMKNAAKYYHDRVAAHGGYVYYYSPDLSQRLGEGVATVDQIWVQPPGTPTVGMAMLAACRATGDEFYLNAAREAAYALIYGQLRSGGWTNAIDFAPGGSRSGDYRNGKGRGKNNPTFDDNISQAACRFLMHFDQATSFKDAQVHEAVQVALAATLAAQFANGAFPQVWTGPVPSKPVTKAVYPTYEWRTENRIKNYWDLYTLNDDLSGYVADLLIDAHRIYGDEKYRQSLRKLGDFLILAQMPEPQPAWAQQYDYEMRPVWARKFEPPAISGRESQDAIATLLKVYANTRDEKYLKPIPAALAYLKKSQLPDGKLSRYYELTSNRPLYMTPDYKLTNDGSKVPGHYGWTWASRVDELAAEMERLKKEGAVAKSAGDSPPKPARVQEIISSLDDQNRWLSEHSGEGLVGQPRFRVGEKYLSSQVFSDNLTALARYVTRDK